MRIDRTDRKRKAFISMDLGASLALLVFVIVPLAYSFQQEQRLCRAYYFRAVAMEIVDGEMEILAVGGWSDYEPGVYDYDVTAQAAQNLPPGGFRLTREPDICRLEWIPAKRWKGGRVSREFKIPRPQGDVELSEIAEEAVDES